MHPVFLTAEGADQPTAQAFSLNRCCKRPLTIIPPKDPLPASLMLALHKVAEIAHPKLVKSCLPRSTTRSKPDPSFANK